MAKKYYIGIDQGTTGSTVLILDENWQQVGFGYSEYELEYPHPGWVEKDPKVVWESIKLAMQQALQEAGCRMDEIACIGLDNEGETCMIWDKKTGEPVYNAIVWQDRRTANRADKLAAEHGEEIREKTGVVIDSYFSATKIEWILNNVEGVRERAERGELLASTLDGFVIWKMTHGAIHITDASTASRTMLLNIHKGDWDQDILNWLDIPREILPTVKNSSEVYAYTDPQEFFGMHVPISGAVVDQQSALFGQACFKSGNVKTTYGTGAFMLMNVGDQPIFSENGLVTTIGWRLQDKLTFALDGGIYITGAAIKWLRDKMNFFTSTSETSEMAASLKSTHGVMFVPAFAGLAAPHWDQYARGTILGITGGTTKEDIVRATLESVAYQVSDNLKVMNKDSGISIEVMRADGGMVKNPWLMQFQADILGIPIDVPVITETTALGAAYLAALGIGDFSSLDDISAHWQLQHRYEPNMSEEKRANLLYHWSRAVEKSKDWMIHDDPFFD